MRLHAGAPVVVRGWCALAPKGRFRRFCRVLLKTRKTSPLFSLILTVLGAPDKTDETVWPCRDAPRRTLFLASLEHPAGSSGHPLCGTYAAVRLLKALLRAVHTV